MYVCVGLLYVEIMKKIQLCNGRKKAVYSLHIRKIKIKLQQQQTTKSNKYTQILFKLRVNVNDDIILLDDGVKFKEEEMHENEEKLWLEVYIIQK